MHPLRRHLDPLAPFRNINAGSARDRAEALAYNRRHRSLLLGYALRWSAIALACLAVLTPFARAAQVDAFFGVPFAAAALGFATGVCGAAISMAVYVVLGLE